MYRFRPSIEMKLAAPLIHIATYTSSLCSFIFNRAYPLHMYNAKCSAAAALIHMIMNNLSPSVAQVFIK